VSAPHTDKNQTTRRAFIVDGASAVAATTVAGRLITGRRPWYAKAAALNEPRAWQVDALQVLGRTQMRSPGSLPFPSMPAGTDTIPEIEHVVVLMMENHSYDNFLGMLGRGPGKTPRGDGYTLGADGRPTASNPYPNGSPLRAFHMPTTCQLSGHPSQEWAASHIQYAEGTNNGFVVSPSGPVAMGYWDGTDLPFTYDLVTQFPIGDRWFCCALAQTDPNRRFLIAATSMGMTDDIGTSAGNTGPDLLLATPPNGTIFERLSSAGISWIDYAESFPTGATMELYPSVDGAYSETNIKPIDQFFTDAAAGNLPSFCLLDPNYSTQSQENPQNIVVGEAFLAQVVNALGSSPKWLKTILLLTYDEHGGYYDHVPPPVALAPDDVGPVVQPGESTYDGFKRYGFRVPSAVVGPYAKRNYVSHVVYDHTSILAFAERKWNLEAMTYRDANANDLTDFIDMPALAKGQPTFPELPKLAAAGENAKTLACSTTGPGLIPPPNPPAPAGSSKAQKLELRYLGVNRHLKGAVVELETNRGSISGVQVDLYRGKRRLAQHKLGHVTTRERRVVLRVNGKPPRAGRYTVLVRAHGKTLAHRAIKVG
jgi:phospholipase C